MGGDASLRYVIAVNNVVSGIICSVFYRKLLPPRYSGITTYALIAALSLSMGIYAYFFKEQYASVLAAVLYSALVFFWILKAKAYQGAILYIYSLFVSYVAELSIHFLIFHTIYVRNFSNADIFMAAAACFIIDTVIASLLFASVKLLKNFLYAGITFNRAVMFIFLAGQTALSTVYSAVIMRVNLEFRLSVYFVSVFAALQVLSLLLIYSYFRKDRQLAEERFLNQQTELRAEYYENIRRQFEKLQWLKHDYRNYMNTIAMLIQDKKYERAFDLARDVDAEAGGVSLPFRTGSELVDAVLYQKAMRAKEAGVELNAAMPGIGCLPLDDKDMCSLLTNLLDNAVEAAKDAPGRKTVEIRGVLDMGHYAVIVENTYAEREGMADGAVVSRDGGSCGFGTKIIEDIARRYNGSYRFTMENGVFIGVVVFPAGL